MTTHLYLLRHAEAETAAGGSDLERDLTAAGADAAGRAACALGALGLRFDRGLTSPALRALRTAEIFWRTLGKGDLELVEALAPGADAETITKLLTELSRPDARLKRLLVTGHMPDLISLLRHLSRERVSAAVSFAPCGMARLDFETAVRAKAGALKWSLKPGELAALSDPGVV